MIVLDLVLARALRDGVDLGLRFKEFRLLSYLVHARRPVSREELYRVVHGLNFRPETNALVVTASRLRTKLSPLEVILTVEGFGYEVDHTLITVESRT